MRKGNVEHKHAKPVTNFEGPSSFHLYVEVEQMPKGYDKLFCTNLNFDFNTSMTLTDSLVCERLFSFFSSSSSKQSFQKVTSTLRYNKQSTIASTALNK